MSPNNTGGAGESEGKSFITFEHLVTIIIAVSAAITYYFTGYSTVQDNLNEIKHLKEWKVEHTEKDKELRKLVSKLKDWKISDYSHFKSKTTESVKKIVGDIEKLEKMTEENTENLRDFIDISNIRSGRD